MADVAGERRPDGSYEHQTVIVTVPRQTGKTTLIRAVGTFRALMGRDFFYTAQTGKDARARWMDLVKQLRVTPALAGRVKIALRGGSEHVEFPGGGVFQAFAPTAESLHGYTPPSVCLDEAFAHSQTEGNLLMGAINPAQQTNTDRQLWIVSTMGTAESTFLHGRIDRALDGVPRTALFYWGATEDQDPYDLDDIAAFHPSVGHVINGKLMTAQDVLAAADELDNPAEYVRAYANRRTLTSANLITSASWRTLEADRLDPPASWRDATLAYDVDLDQGGAALTLAWRTPDGTPAVKVVRFEPGAATWLADGVDQLVKKYSPAALVALGNGPVLDTTAELRRRGHNVTEVKDRDWVAATEAFLAILDDGHGLAHDRDPVLEGSVTGLATRDVGDGAAFSRRRSHGYSSPAVAAVGALHQLRAAPTGEMVVRFG